MKWLAGFVALFATTLTLFADGSSGDFLRSPEHTETTTKQFGGSSDTYKDSRGGWYCTGDKGYARKNGVGLRANATGALCYDFPEEKPEYIHTLTLECSTATKDSATKENAITFTLELESGDVYSDTATFITESQTTSVNLTFNLEEALAVKRMSFTNSGAQIFELGAVSWAGALPELSADFSVAPTRIELQGDFHITISNVKGGSGVYTYASVKFLDDLCEWANPIFPVGYIFTAPAASGDYPVEFCVRDDEGNEFRETKNIFVTPYASPCDIVVSNVTRDGFDLAWNLSSGATPISYNLSLTEVVEKAEAKVTLVPTWTEVESGVWQTESISLVPWTAGKDVVASYLTAHAYTGNVWLSTNEGKTWAKKFYVAEAYLLGRIVPNPDQRIMLKVDAPPPSYITIEMPRIQGEKKTISFETASQQRTYHVEGLTSGTTYSVVLGAVFEKVDSDSVAYVSYEAAPFNVTLEALPTFSNAVAYEKWRRLQLTWPSGEKGLSAEINIFSQKILPCQTPAGLYLSRILWTKSGGGLTTSKAIAITNTSNRPIRLRGGYTLKAVKRDTGTTRVWDFSEKDEEGEVIYPYVVPAGGELLFAHNKYLPEDERDGLLQTSVSTLNFTGDWDLSLWQAETLQNTLAPQTNAVVRLVEDSLSEVQTVEITAEMPLVDSFYTPWMALTETKHLETRTIEQASSAMAIISYAVHMENIDDTRKIWATYCTKKDDEVSVLKEITLWAPIDRVGYVFQLR